MKGANEMTVWYEIMDQGTANMVGDFATEEEALRLVARYVAAHGRAAVAAWALARDGERDEDFLLVAVGEALAERARATDPAAAD